MQSVTMEVPRKQRKTRQLQRMIKHEHQDMTVCVYVSQSTKGNDQLRSSASTAARFRHPQRCHQNYKVPWGSLPTVFDKRKGLHKHPNALGFVLGCVGGRKWKNFGGAIFLNSLTELRPLPFRAPNRLHGTL